MRRNILKIALLAATATIATATPALANNTTTTPADPDAQSTLVTFTSDDDATPDTGSLPGSGAKADDANPDTLPVGVQSVNVPC